MAMMAETSTKFFIHNHMGDDMSKGYEVLKCLAKMGAVSDFVTLTTVELGECLGISQQTASNRIRELLDDGLISRKMGVKEQKIKLTKKGVDLLKKEMSELRALLDGGDDIIIRGIVSTGLGEGQYYVMQDGYKSQFKEKLGFMPAEGTLNIKVDEEEMEKLDTVSESLHILIEGFESQGRSFGRVTCIPAVLGGKECAVVIPKRSHHTDVIEVLSKFYLRKTLGLKDGDTAELTIGR